MLTVAVPRRDRARRLAGASYRAAPRLHRTGPIAALWRIGRRGAPDRPVTVLISQRPVWVLDAQGGVSSAEAYRIRIDSISILTCLLSRGMWTDGEIIPDGVISID